jgi:hypothetical protein
MMTKINPFVTETLDVRWSHLHRPDDKFGADSANHNITVVISEELQMKLDELVQENGASKVNGTRTEDDGTKTLRVKSKIHVKDGTTVFPCHDALSSPTNAVPFGGDKVRLRIKPMLLDRDNSLSLYLNGVQIIEKNESSSSSGGFEPTEGFTGNVDLPDSESDDSMPF